MKYIVLVPDGMADEPLMQLGGKTPLEAAHTPHMDFLVKNGLSGLVQTIPDGFPPGSDIGNLALMGYDPKICFSGRSPLEAANMGIMLAEDEVAFRCNLTTIVDEKMVDYSAGHITSEEAADLITALNNQLKNAQVRFYPGKSYRHILVIKSNDKSSFIKVKTTPPHDILNQSVAVFLPQGGQSDFLLDLMRQSVEILANHPVNKKRLQAGLLPATRIWLWGQGAKPHLPLFKDRYGLSGSVISAVDLVNGIGRLAGLDVIDVPGANGYYDTNYEGKAKYGLDSLKQHDFIYIHIEAPDEAGHNGDWENKKLSIEKIDAMVVKPIRDYIEQYPQTRVLIAPDHPTPIAKRTHTRAPVPFVIAGHGVRSNGLMVFSEASAASKGIIYQSGESLLKSFFDQSV